MATLPRITVVTPSYNQACYLEETIESVLTQKYPNLEYIVIDGGSTDGSVEIIRNYSDKMKYWISEPDQGQSHAINKGFTQATGDILCWLNSDDVFLPGALACVGEQFQRRPQVDMLMGYTVFVSAEKRIQRCVYNLMRLHMLAKYGVIAFSQQSMFWRRELLERVGCLDESLHACMDVDLWIRFLKASAKVRRINRYLAAWRLHSACKSVAFDGFAENKPDAARLEASTIWDKERRLLRERHRDYRYGNTARWAIMLYRIYKLCYGDYVRDLMFRVKWKDKPLEGLSRSLDRSHLRAS